MLKPAPLTIQGVFQKFKEIAQLQGHSVRYLLRSEYFPHPNLFFLFQSVTIQKTANH